MQEHIAEDAVREDAYAELMCQQAERELCQWYDEREAAFTPEVVEWLHIEGRVSRCGGRRPYLASIRRPGETRWVTVGRFASEAEAWAACPQPVPRPAGKGIQRPGRHRCTVEAVPDRRRGAAGSGVRGSQC